MSVDIADLPGTSLEGGDVEVANWSKLPTEPLVSVWMITYNHMAYIREALDSVLMQQVDFPYEICLGEDGSTDGTREICLEYVRKHPEKIRLFLRDRRNPARQKYKAAFMYNCAATYDACRGKYITLLEGDDYWVSPRKLATQYALLQAEPGVSVCGHYFLYFSASQPWKSTIAPMSRIDRFTLASVVNGSLYVHTSTMMVRRDPTIDWSQIADVACGDTPLLWWCLRHGTGVLLPEVMSVYRATTGGAFLKQPMLTKIRRAVETHMMLKPMVPDRLHPVHHLEYCRLLVRLLEELRKSRHRTEAVGCFMRIVRLGSDVFRHSRRRALCLWLAASEALVAPRLRQLRLNVAARIRVRLSRGETQVDEPQDDLTEKIAARPRRKSPQLWTGPT